MTPSSYQDRQVRARPRTDLHRDRPRTSALATPCRRRGGTARLRSGRSASPLVRNAPCPCGTGNGARPHGSRQASRRRGAGSWPSPDCPAWLPGRRMRGAGSPPARASRAFRPWLPVDGAPRFPGTGLTREAPVLVGPTPRARRAPNGAHLGSRRRREVSARIPGRGERRAPQVAERCFLGYPDRVGAESRPSRSLALAAARCGPPVQVASAS